MARLQRLHEPVTTPALPRAQTVGEEIANSVSHGIGFLLAVAALPVLVHAAEIWARGGEGVVIKDAEGVYRRERSNRWLKYKQRGWATRKMQEQAYV